MTTARTLPLLMLALACSKEPGPTDEPVDTDTASDTDVPWSPPPAGPFQFETKSEAGEGLHWLVDAHYFPASKRGRPAVLFASGRWSTPEECGITDWPEGMVEPFIERDWTVIVTDHVGCRETHYWHRVPDEIKARHRIDVMLAQLARKLRADGYGPITVMGMSADYWVKGRDPDVPQMKAAVQLGTSNMGNTNLPLTTSLPFKWLLLVGEDNYEALLERRAFQGFWEDGPYPEWTIWYGHPDALIHFTRLGKAEPDLWEKMAEWLEPHLEGAYEAGPEAWETP